MLKTFPTEDKDMAADFELKLSNSQVQLCTLQNIINLRAGQKTERTRQEGVYSQNRLQRG